MRTCVLLSFLLQIYMLVIRLSPHRDARPRHISKPVCVLVCMCVCVCYYYTNAAIFITGMRRNTSFGCCLCCQSFFGSPPWGHHEGCNTTPQLAYAAYTYFHFLPFYFADGHQRGQLAACRAINVSIIICALSILQRRSFVSR